MTEMISVIIPTGDDALGAAGAANTLRHAAMGMRSCEFIIASDAGSAVDGKLARALSADIQVARNFGEQRGFAGKCNQAAEIAEGDILFFVSDAVWALPELSQDWDEVLGMEFASQPEVGIIGFKLVFPDMRLRHAGVCFDQKRQPYHRFYTYENHYYSPANQPEAVKAVAGSALAIRGDLFEALGGFDQALFPDFFADTDLCLRAGETGATVWYEPRSAFVDDSGQTQRDDSFRPSALAFKRRWVDSDKLTADSPMLQVNFW